MKILFLSLFLMITLNAAGQNEAFDAYLKALDPDIIVSVTVLDKSGEVRYAKNEKLRVPSASVIKIPVLIELSQQVDEKRLKWKEKIKLHTEDRVGGSGDLQYEAAGKKFTIEELAVKMIAVSDNVATNLLIDRIGMENVNLGLENWGFDETRLNRKMMDFKAIQEGKQNYITSFEVSKMLWGLLTKRILKDQSSKKALEILLKCEDVTTIPRKIPKTVPVAHKSGTLDYVRGDAGIIFSREPVIVSVFVQNFESQEQAEKIIGELAEIAYQTYGK